MTTSTKLLSPDDLAAHFGTNRRTILEWAKRHRWPRTQIGRTLRWTPEQLEQIERLHTVTPEGGIEAKDGRTARSAARAS